MLELLTVAGIIICPRFTLACILFYFDKPILGIIALIFMVIHKTKEG